MISSIMPPPVSNEIPNRGFMRTPMAQYNDVFGDEEERFGYWGFVNGGSIDIHLRWPIMMLLTRKPPQKQHDLSWDRAHAVLKWALAGIEMDPFRNKILEQLEYETFNSRQQPEGDWSRVYTSYQWPFVRFLHRSADWRDFDPSPEHPMGPRFRGWRCYQGERQTFKTVDEGPYGAPRARYIIVDDRPKKEQIVEASVVDVSGDHIPIQQHV